MSRWLYLALILLYWPMNAGAHERWVDHAPRAPIAEDIFREFTLDSLSLMVRPLILFTLLAVFWSQRLRLSSALKRRLNPFLSKVVDFIFNSESSPLLPNALSSAISTLAIRIPALVLIYAATSSSLMMPSFPLEGGLNTAFRALQAILAIMIIAEIALPLVGILIALAVGFCFAHFGVNVSIDILPVLGLSYIYMLMPWKGGSTNLRLNPFQIRVLQVIIGSSFFLLGVMKIVNFELTVGVADNYPFIMKDPLIAMFSWGSDAKHAREWWTFGFACSEMLTGALLAFGIFMRPLAVFSAMIFAKLMLVDFGWAEIPHIFPIAILMLIGTSSVLPASVLSQKALTRSKQKEFEESLRALNFHEPRRKAS